MSEVTAVVVSEVSVYGRNENAYRPTSSSGSVQNRVATATAPDHQASSRQRGTGRGRVRMYRTGATSTASTATAFTPPHSATASADLTAPRARWPVSDAVSSGMRIHGSIAAGSHSMEISPRMDSVRGASAYASAPAIRVPGVPIPSCRDSRSTPRKATLMSSVSQSRCVTHGSTPTRSPRAKNGPIGKT